MAAAAMCGGSWGRGGAGVTSVSPTPYHLRPQHTTSAASWVAPPRTTSVHTGQQCVAHRGFHHHAAARQGVRRHSCHCCLYVGGVDTLAVAPQQRWHADAEEVGLCEAACVRGGGRTAGAACVLGAGRGARGQAGAAVQRGGVGGAGVAASGGGRAGWPGRRRGSTRLGACPASAC